jgi:hypothetical protein
MKDTVIAWVRNHVGWIILAILVVAGIDALAGNSVIFPLVLIVAACGLAAYRYWDAIKVFDWWAFDEWVRARSGAMGVKDWHTPYHAVEYFCDPILVDARNAAATEMNTIMMELIRDQDREVGIRVGASQGHAKYESAQHKHAQLNEMLALELRKQRVAGTLVAKGLPVEDDAARSERIIPESRWRVMTLDIAKAEASGQGGNFMGVVIGQKPVKLQPAAREARTTDPAPQAPRAPAPMPPPTAADPRRAAPRPQQPAQPQQQGRARVPAAPPYEQPRRPR